MLNTSLLKAKVIMKGQGCYSHEAYEKSHGVGKLNNKTLQPQQAIPKDLL